MRNRFNLATAIEEFTIPMKGNGGIIKSQTRYSWTLNGKLIKANSTNLMKIDPMLSLRDYMIYTDKAPKIKNPSFSHQKTSILAE